MARYIDAEVLKRKLIDEKNFFPSLVARAIDETPEADVVEVKHGHWIWLEGNLYECSECPNRTEVDEAMNEPLYIYCPYCGAKMDGGKK
jgi:DNA-directed RNA polymerase subunit RPC12/RpoP